MRALILTAMLFVWAVRAHAGPISSGGGQGVLCKTHGRETVELLDLWEARVVYGRKIAVSKTPLIQQMDRALEILKFAISADGDEMVIAPSTGSASPPTTALSGAEALKQMLRGNAICLFDSACSTRVRHIHGGHLDLTQDAYEVVRPDNCQIVQLARYTDTNGGGSILIDQDYVDKMDATNLAALALHEAFYANLRQTGQEPSSIRVRRAIGYAFAGQNFADPSQLLAREKFLCRDDHNFVAVTREPAAPGQTPVDFLWSATIMTINGRARIGYDGAFATNQGRSEDPFAWYEGKEGLSDQSTFGQTIGFDYNTKLRLGKDADGKRFADIELTSGPDLTEPYKATLPCWSTDDPHRPHWY